MYATHARFVAERVNIHALSASVEEILCVNFADYYNQEYELKHIAITKGAFPEAEERELIGYVSYCQQHIVDKDIQILLLYAAFCILGEISYTRKDGIVCQALCKFGWSG